MKVSVVTPNYNGLKFLKAYFDSLALQAEFIEEIVIVDNGSEDGSVEFIESLNENYPVDIKLIKNKENLGFAPAVNQGIRASKSEYVYSLNNDVELEKDTVEMIVRDMDDSIAIGENPFSFSSKMIQFNNRNLIDDAGDEYTILGWTRKAGDGKPLGKYDEKREIFSSCGGAALYRRSVLDEIGMFDDNFFAYLEDIDLSYRAQINGYKNFFSPRSIVYHKGSGTSGSRYNEFKVRISARNNLWLAYKNLTLPQKILNFIFLFIGFFIKYVFFLRKGFGHFYLEGLKEGFKTRKKLDRVEFKRANWKNYFKIEWKLIKNTINYLRI